MKKLLLLPLTILVSLVGSVNWAPPPWISSLHLFFRSNPKKSMSLGLLIVASVLGYLYYDALPKPLRVTAYIDELHVSPNYEGARPSNLLVRFEYDSAELNDGQVVPEGEPSVARIDLVGQVVTEGLSLTPAMTGKWQWTDGHTLQFEPDNDWPAGTDYAVTVSKHILAAGTLLSADTYHVSTPAFEAQFSDSEFYLDPKEPSVRRVVSTLTFSHPVDKTSLEKNLSMAMLAVDSSKDTAFKVFDYTLSYDKNFRQAYIHSEAVSLPEKSNYMKLALQAGVMSILGGQPSDQNYEEKVMIPDLYSFLKVNYATSDIVRNEKNEPEQVVVLEFTDAIEKDTLLSKLSLTMLPQVGQRNGKNHWREAREVNANVLADSQGLALQLIPNERNASKTYSFIVDVPENRYLYLKVEEGLTSVNHFVQTSFYDTILQAPSYPKEVGIAGEGAVLTYSGDHQLSILTRGVSSLKYSVGRLLDGQINHLVSQTRGDISNPDFNSWQFDEQNLAEFESKMIRLGSKHPKKANYSSFDLSSYLPKSGQRFGLFFVDVKAWDARQNAAIYGVQDKRLILVTDLGLIVKNNADQSHEVFVQSISNGEPVAGAKVALLGKNGIRLFEGETGEDGHVSLPSTRGLSDEKSPTVYVVQFQNDLSFIPFDRYSRQINLSRFDIGGTSTDQYRQDSLNAFLFTDRGIYRPGETVNIGLIVKNNDLSNVENIPLEWVIRGPRGNEVRVNKFRLPDKGLGDFQFRTQASSDTGSYTASLHLVRNNKYRGREIGGVNFKVEEFQADTMKINSRLLEVTKKGWSTADNIDARVALNNLFGTPAQGRKVSARMIVQPHNFVFKDYADYDFTAPFIGKGTKPLSINMVLPDQQSDADGITQFELNLQAFQEGAYRLEFIAEGFDQAGGRSVVASNSTLISPLKTLVGFKADGKLNYINVNSARGLEFIAIDNELNKVDQDGITLKLIHVQSVSTLVKQTNGTYKYQTIQKRVDLSSEQVSISRAGLPYQIDTKTPGDYVLEMIDAKQRILARLDYSVVGFANLAGKLDKNSELQLKLNKEDYYPGDMIEMSIKAPYAGAGLISIETDRVHAFKWFKTAEESTLQQIQIPDSLEGTAYINVAFVRDVASTEVFTSPLSYAVMPFSIDKSKRRVDVTLTTTEIARPGKPMSIHFSASKPSKVAVFAVDEGILQLARYKTPDPLAHFLKKRALNVETLQILDLILPDFDLVKALSSVGGGSDAEKALGKNLNPFSRKTDKPAVYWSGIYDADTDDRIVFFDVPNTFAGELRIVAVAVSDEAVGATSTTSLVRGPFVISPNVLTHAAPGDEFLVTVGVANIIEGSGKAAPIELSVSASEHIEIIGDSRTHLNIDEGNEDKFTFRMKATAVLGAAELNFRAHYSNGDTQEEGSRTASLSVRPASIYYSSLNSGFEPDGSIDLILNRQLYADLAKQKVAASASPLVIVDGLTSYLEAFPHGCTEQVVSKVFPLVGLMTLPAYATHIKNVQVHFNHLIQKLRERQQSNGGFAFWPGQRRSSVYPSIYAMHFLLESEQLGYPVPSDMFIRGRAYLKDYVADSSSSLSGARDRANAIYLLTRMGEVTSNFLIDLQEELEQNYQDLWRQDILASYVAATYKLLQKDQQAEHLINGYSLDSDRHKDLDDFHSQLAVDAQHVYLLARHFKTRAKALDGDHILQLTKKIFEGEYNTISAAYSILALGAYSQLVVANDADENVGFKAIDHNGQSRILEAALQPFLQAAYDVDTQSLKISGDHALFYLNAQSGFDTNMPTQAVKQGIEIYRDFVDESGDVVTDFVQGKELTVRLKVRALDGRSLANVAVIDLLPGGFEIVPSSVARNDFGWQADYVDIREDRVVYYGAFDHTVRELSYRVKVTSAGEFVVPPAYAESMYDRSVRAVSKAGNITVTASQ
jgi:uncharacterized protein YfaS (alpha-2-macroglobulin family)